MQNNRILVKVALITTLFCSESRGQVVNSTNLNATLNDLKGVPLTNRGNTFIEGSPFLSDEWEIAKLKLTNGLIFERVPTKINLATQEIHYLNSQNQEMVAVATTILEVSFSNPSLGDFDIYIQADGNRQIICRQVSVGPCILLRNDIKTILEEKPFNSATVTRRYSDQVHYYLHKENSLVKVPKTKTDLIKLFSKKEDEIKHFIESNRIKLKSEADLQRVVAYYNTLVPN